MQEAVGKQDARTGEVTPSSQRYAMYRAINGALFGPGEQYVRRVYCGCMLVAIRMVFFDPGLPLEDFTPFKMADGQVIEPQADVDTVTWRGPVDGDSDEAEVSEDGVVEWSDDDDAALEGDAGAE